MKNVGLLSLLVIVMSLGMGCDESKGPAYVYGSGSIIPPQSSDDFDGELSQSGNSTYYGYCKYSGGEFEFEVGHASIDRLDEVNNGNPLYFNFTGIVGPDGGAPVQGVFEPGTTTPKSGDEYASTFARGKVKSSDTFVFTPDASSSCGVVLFAEPLPGELVPDRNKEFEYYIEINCSGMSSITGTNGLPLQSVNLGFYLDNC